MDDRDCKFVGNSFFDCTINGEPMCVGDEPTILGDPSNGNVAFPKGWTEEQAAAWRKLFNCYAPEEVESGP